MSERKAAGRASKIFCDQQQFKYLISAGFAGALDQELQVGNLLLAENFSSPELLDSPHLDFADDELFVGKLATVPGIVDSKSERDRWAAETGAAAVDMETEFIAAACAAHRVPMLSLRAISDTASEPLPGPAERACSIWRNKGQTSVVSRSIW